MKSQISEAPIKATEYMERYDIGASLMSALRRGMKLPKGCHFVVESDVNKFRRDNPGFTQRDAYPVKQKTTSKIAVQSDQSKAA